MFVPKTSFPPHPICRHHNQTTIYDYKKITNIHTETAHPVSKKILRSFTFEKLMLPIVKKAEVGLTLQLDAGARFTILG